MSYFEGIVSGNEENYFQQPEPLSNNDRLEELNEAQRNRYLTPEESDEINHCHTQKAKEAYEAQNPNGAKWNTGEQTQVQPETAKEPPIEEGPEGETTQSREEISQPTLEEIYPSIPVIEQEEDDRKFREWKKENYDSDDEDHCQEGIECYGPEKAPRGTPSESEDERC